MTTAADPSITLALARSLWAAGMDAGHGYAPESSDPETAARALGSVLLQPVTGEDVWVVRTPAGQIVVVGGTQAWAVDITEALAGEVTTDDGIEMELRAADLGFSVGHTDETRIATVAQEWRDEEFSASQVSTWLAAGCFRADAAAGLRDAGVSTGEAGQTWRDGMTVGYAVANSDLTAAQAVAFLRTADLCAEVAGLVGDDGTGDLGVIVRQALLDDPAVTAAEVAEIVCEAQTDAAREAE